MDKNKKIAVEMTEEQYEKLIVDDMKKQRTPVASIVLTAIACIIFIIGFFVGLDGGLVEVQNGKDTDFFYSWYLIFGNWIAPLFYGMALIGIAEIIKILNKMNNK